MFIQIKINFALGSALACLIRNAYMCEKDIRASPVDSSIYNSVWTGLTPPEICLNTQPPNFDLSSRYRIISSCSRVTQPSVYIYLSTSRGHVSRTWVTPGIHDRDRSFGSRYHIGMYIYFVVQDTASSTAVSISLSLDAGITSSVGGFFFLQMSFFCSMPFFICSSYRLHYIVIRADLAELNSEGSMPGCDDKHALRAFSYWGRARARAVKLIA